MEVWSSLIVPLDIGGMRRCFRPGRGRVRWEGLLELVVVLLTMAEGSSSYLCSDVTSLLSSL